MFAAQRSTTLPDFETALSRVILPTGIQASDGELFGGAIFGRDSLLVALDLYDSHPELARVVVLGLARLQGARRRRFSEEEVGKIHHEYRSVRSDTHVSAQIKDLVAAIAAQRQVGSARGFTYYGTVDATPQYIRLLARYCRQYGTDILDQPYQRRSGARATIHESLLAAIDWLVGRLEASSLGLLESVRANPHGLYWHVLRDGTTSYLHTNGHLANPNAPLASIEVQGLAYDALLEAADLLASHPHRSHWVTLAERLRLHTLQLMWMPDEAYFAMGLDRDADGLPRQIQTITSLPAELLNTRLFDDLPRSYSKKIFVEAIVRKLYSPDLMTPVGPRMRGLHYAALLPYLDYQGSCTSWPVSTRIIAQGLQRQKLPELSADMTSRMLQGLASLGTYSELVYVDVEGRLIVPTIKTKATAEFAVTNIPETTQAWTVSAAIWAQHSQNITKQSAGWRAELSRSVLKLPAAAHELKVVRGYLSTADGRRREATYLRQEGFIA